MLLFNLFRNQPEETERFVDRLSAHQARKQRQTALERAFKEESDNLYEAVDFTSFCGGREVEYDISELEDDLVDMLQCEFQEAGYYVENQETTLRVTW
jgi:hypothetical protein